MPDAGACERGDEGLEERDVVGMDDALGGAERDRAGQRRAADGQHPPGARIGAPQAARREDREPADEREAQEPAGLAAEARVEQPQPAGRPAERTAGRPPGAEAAGDRASRPARLAVEAAEAVVVEDQRPDAVVARA